MNRIITTLLAALALTAPALAINELEITQYHVHAAIAFTEALAIDCPAGVTEAFDALELEHVTICATTADLAWSDKNTREFSTHGFTPARGYMRTQSWTDEGSAYMTQFYDPDMRVAVSIMYHPGAAILVYLIALLDE